MNASTVEKELIEMEAAANGVDYLSKPSEIPCTPEIYRRKSMRRKLACMRKGYPWGKCHTAIRLTTMQRIQDLWQWTMKPLRW